MTTSPPPDAAATMGFAELLDRARALSSQGGRRILGIVGAPGAGKTTLAERLADALGDDAALVTMDGFHLANSVLRTLNSRDRKGAPDTFDAAGYVALLERLRRQRSDASDVVYAPVFDRELDASIGSSISVRGDVPLVITEGNYLLLESGGWSGVRPLLDEAWFLAPPEELRVERLIRRHEHYGLDRNGAAAWALGTDQRNADLVAGTRASADLVIQLVE